MYPVLVFELSRVSASDSGEKNLTLCRSLRRADPLWAARKNFEEEQLNFPQVALILFHSYCAWLPPRIYLQSNYTQRNSWARKGLCVFKVLCAVWWLSGWKCWAPQLNVGLSLFLHAGRGRWGWEGRIVLVERQGRNHALCFGGLWRKRRRGSTLEEGVGGANTSFSSFPCGSTTSSSLLRLLTLLLLLLGDLSLRLTVIGRMLVLLRVSERRPLWFSSHVAPCFYSLIMSLVFLQCHCLFWRVCFFFNHWAA